MLHTVTAEGMRAIERHAIEHIGMPALLMMERAAMGVAQCIAETGGAGCLAVFLCGGGNNGGDGLAAARLHINSGGRAHVILLAPPDKLPKDAYTHYAMLVNMGVRIHNSPEDAPRADVIVDALLGTGLSSAPRGAYAQAIEWANACGKPIIAVDVPSGADATNGRVYGVCACAERTVTFGFMKQGLTLFPARSRCGVVSVYDIGLPSPSVDPDGADIFEDSDAAALLPPRKTEAHKGDFGHAGIIAGSAGMAGAAALCARGALRGGAGLVTVACPQETVMPVVQTRVCEAMAAPLEDLDIAAFLRGKAAVAIGPGLGREAQAERALESLLDSAVCPIVCDADALNIMAAWREEEGRVGGCAPPAPPLPRLILTPHPGEMARLMGTSAAAVLDDPLGVTRACARLWNAVVLLKGATTVVARPDGYAALSLTGTPGMATGGSGDVLTGLIAALLCQGLSTFDAAAAGAHIHGRAGERAARLNGERGMTAWDIAEGVGLSC